LAIALERCRRVERVASVAAVESVDRRPAVCGKGEQRADPIHRRRA
jgi:hypothetical protein